MDSILPEAHDLIQGDRSADYGPPEVNFRRWADLCRALDRPHVRDLTPEDIALVMVLGKLARETNSHKRDNQVDAAAYLDIYERLVT